MHESEACFRLAGSGLEFEDGLDEAGLEAGPDPGDGDGLVRSLGDTRAFPEIIFDRTSEN
jgi:hypothetical protein